MTVLNVSTGQLAMVLTAWLLLALGFILCCAFGVFRFSVSIGAIPPWNRRPAVKKMSVPAVAATPGEGNEAPAAGTAPKAVRKVS